MGNAITKMFIVFKEKEEKERFNSLDRDTLRKRLQIYFFNHQNPLIYFYVR